MRRVTEILVVIAAVGCVRPAEARQDHLEFELLTQEQGLLGMGITGAYQDRYGFIWTGSLNGLQVYDGFLFRDFRDHETAPAAVRYGTASEVCEAPDGGIWIATDDGLARYDRLSDSFEHYRHDPADPSTLSSNRLMAITCDSAGRIWADSWEAGLNRVVRDPDGVRITRFRHDPNDSTSLSSDFIGSVAVDPGNSFWVGTGRSLDRIDPETGHSTHFLYRPDAPEPGAFDVLDYPGYPRNAINDVLPDSSGAIWVGRGDGLYRFEPQTGAIRRIPLNVPAVEGVQPDWIHRLARGPGGHIWVGTQTGLYEVVPSSGRVVRHELPRVNERSFFGGFALAILIDRSGVLWVGTDGWLSRADLFDRRPHRIQLERNGNVSAFAAADDEGMWIATTSGDVHRFDPFTRRAVRADLDLQLPKYRTDAAISALAEDDDGTLWIGSYRAGLRGFRPGSRSIVTLRHAPGDAASLDSDSVRSIVTDRKGGVWVGTSRGLNRMVRRDNGKPEFVHFDQTGGDAQVGEAPDVQEVLEDADGAIWVRTPLEMLKLDRSTARFHPAGPTDLHRARSGSFRDAVSARLWLDDVRHNAVADSSSNSLADRALDLLTRFGGPDCLVVDSLGTSWMTTRHGVLHVDPAGSFVHHYGEEKGLERASFSRGSSCARSHEGRIYFAGRPGAYLIEPWDFDDNPYPPASLITGVALRGRPLVPGVDAPLTRLAADMEAVTFAHDQNDITLSFLATHYSQPELNTYEVRLLEYEDAWRSIGTARTARFTSLQPGTYRFQVRAISPVGEVGNPSTLGIVIRPPWWRTGWALAAYLALAVGMVIATTRYRERRLRRRANELQEEVDERTRDLDLARRHAERQAQRLEDLDRAKSHFFANVSHEFRTPLTLILGPLQDVTDGRAKSDRLRDQVPMMRRNARRLLSLINELLDLSKLEAGALQLQARPTDLVPFVRGLTLAFSSKAEREHLTLLFEAEVERVEAWIDHDKLEKVVSNLLSNAFKFTPAGGKIRVSVVKTETHAVISVSDTGPGIPQEQLSRVFDRFYQIDSSASRAHEGTGIGLALAKELVERHGGTIDVRSIADLDTTFEIRLPLGSEHLPAGERAIDRTPGKDTPEADGLEAAEHRMDGHMRADAEDTEKPIVLIVEDNADLRTYLTSQLRDRYAVHTARDGREGLDRARVVHPDLILTDIMMPRMDGYAFCRALKEDDDLSTIPVVMLTARSDEESKLEGLDIGADDYLPKPFSVAELRARVENLLASRAMLRDRYSGEVFVRPSDIPITPEDEVFLERVLDVVNEHLGDSTFSVDWLAGEVGVSRRQLERRVAGTTGDSPAALVRRLRVMRAQQLLRARAGTVSEIAYMVGFRQSSHFARIFRQETGQTPTAYRDQAEDTAIRNEIRN